jgi:DNA-binding IscR family transcriptional regulator
MWQQTAEASLPQEEQPTRQPCQAQHLWVQAASILAERTAEASVSRLVFKQDEDQQCGSSPDKHHHRCPHNEAWS